MHFDVIVGVPECVQDNERIIVVANVDTESQSTDKKKRTVILTHDFATFAEKPAMKD